MGKQLRCCSCNKVLAEEVNIQQGVVKITCKCGIVNEVKAQPKSEGIITGEEFEAGKQVLLAQYNNGEITLAQFNKRQLNLYKRFKPFGERVQYEMKAEGENKPMVDVEIETEKSILTRYNRVSIKK